MVYEQLKKLESCCDVTVKSHLDTHGRTLWHVTATVRDGSHPPITAESADLTDAARHVVGKAAVLGLIRGPVRP